MHLTDVEQTKRILKNSKIEVETLDKALVLPKGVSKEQFFAEYCPPLPLNFELQEDEAMVIGFLIDRRPFERSVIAYLENYLKQRNNV